MDDYPELDKLNDTPLHAAVQIQNGEMVTLIVDHVITVVELCDGDVESGRNNDEGVHSEYGVHVTTQVADLVVDLVDLGHSGSVHVHLT